MADGKRRDEWTHTSNLLAMLANVFGSKSKLTAEDFYPFSKKKKAMPAPFSVLKSVFIDRKAPDEVRIQLP